MANTTVYTDGMVMFKRETTVVVNGAVRSIYDFTVANGIAKARVSGKQIETVCRAGERVSEIKRRLVVESGTDSMTRSEVISRMRRMQTHVNGHIVTRCHVDNNKDGTVTASGFVDGEFTAIRYKAASLDQQGKLHHGKPWLRTAREGLVAEYERNHKATSIVTYQAEKKANVVLAMCDEAFRDDLVAKGVERNGTQYAYLGRPIKVGDNVTQFSVMNQMKEINAEVNDEVKAFFDDLRIS